MQKQGEADVHFESAAVLYNLTAAVPAGKLGALFEHIVASYPQYEPTPLSTSPWAVCSRVTRWPRR